MRLAVLVSGRGSNLENLIRHFGPEQEQDLIRLVGVISDNPNAPALQIAAEAGLPILALHPLQFKDKASFEARMQEQLEAWRADHVALAGFMRLLSAAFVQRWQDRLVNIHPSLLPDFRGLDTHKKALEAGVKQHGCTVHLVRTEVDTGPILLQAALDVLPGEEEASLAARVLALEHRIYPEALRQLAKAARKSR